MSQETFSISRIYVKDVSFEMPNSPDIFKEKWDPKVKVDLNTKSNKLEDNFFEVILKINAEVSIEDKVAFICEIEQAGIFLISDLSQDKLSHCLGAYCPNILFPYAREEIASLVNKASLPPLNLAPVNFDAIYMSYLEKQNQEGENTSGKLDS